MKLLRVKTSASEPALRPGKLFFASRLKKPKRFDLISYRAIVPDAGLTLLTHRLCGLPGDTVLIKGGILYVNQQDADRSLALKHLCKLDKDISETIRYDKEQSYIVAPYTNTIYISLEDRFVKDNQVRCDRHVLPPGVRDDAIFQCYRQNWNRDHFGPLVVPAGSYFVLGDNRGFSVDSRQLGFVAQSKYVGTVLWK